MDKKKYYLEGPIWNIETDGEFNWEPNPASYGRAVIENHTYIAIQRTRGSDWKTIAGKKENANKKTLHKIVDKEKVEKMLHKILKVKERRK